MALLLVAPPSRASDEATAESLFLEAKALLRDGDAAGACPKLAESQRLDPGTGTLLMLALCHERLGRTASAWSEYKEALARARVEQRADREGLALRHIAGLEPHLARVKVVVPEQAVSPFEVRCDGAPLGGTGTVSVPVDPGNHLIEAYARGERRWSIAVVVGSEAEEHEVLVPRLVAPAAADAPPPVAALPVSPAPAKPEHHPLRTLAIASGVVAIAGVAVGAVFGERAIEQSKEAKSLCPAYPCAPGAQTANEGARSAATISDVAFAVAGAGLLGAVSLVILGGGQASGARAAAAPPRVAGVGLGWRGEW